MLDGRCAGPELRGLGSCMHASSAHCPARRNSGLASLSYTPQTLLEARIASGRFASSSCCAANAKTTRPVNTWLWDGVSPHPTQAQRNGHPSLASQPSDSQPARRERGTTVPQRQPRDPQQADIQPQQQQRQQQTQCTLLDGQSRSGPSGSQRPDGAQPRAGQPVLATTSQQKQQQFSTNPQRPTVPNPREEVRRRPGTRGREEWVPSSQTPSVAALPRTGGVGCSGGAGEQPYGPALTQLISQTTCWRQLSALVTQHAQHMNTTHVTAVATRLTHLPLPLSVGSHGAGSQEGRDMDRPMGSEESSSSSMACTSGSSNTSTTGYCLGEVLDDDGGHGSAREASACLSFLCRLVRLVEERAEQLDARGIANIIWALAEVLTNAQDAEPSENVLTTMRTTLSAKEDADMSLSLGAYCGSKGNGQGDGAGGDCGDNGDDDIGSRDVSGGPQQRHKSLQELREAVRAAVVRLLALPAADPETSFRSFQRPVPGGTATALSDGGRGSGGKLQAQHLANMMWAVASLGLGCCGAEQDDGAAEGWQSVGGVSGSGAVTGMWIRKAMVAARRVLQVRAFQGQGLAQVIWAVVEMDLEPTGDWMNLYYNAVLCRAATMSTHSAANVLMCLARLAERCRDAATCSVGSAASFHPPPAFWLPRFLRRSARGLDFASPVALAMSAAALSSLTKLHPYPAPHSPLPDKWLLRYYAALGAPGVLQHYPDKLFSLMLSSLATLMEGLQPTCIPSPPLPPAELITAAQHRLVSGVDSMPDQSFAMASWGLQRLQVLQARSRSSPHPEAYVSLREQQQAARQAAVAARRPEAGEEGPAWQDTWVRAATRRLPGLRGRSLLRVLQSAAGWGAARVNEVWLRCALDAVLRSSEGNVGCEENLGEEEQQAIDIRLTGATGRGLAQLEGEEEGSMYYRPRLLLALMHVADVCLPEGSCPAALLDDVAAAVLAGAVVSGEGGGAAPRAVEESVTRPWSASELLQCGAVLARLGYRPPFAWRQAFLARVLQLAALAQPLPPQPAADSSAGTLSLQEQQSQRQQQQPQQLNGAAAPPRAMPGEPPQPPQSPPSNLPPWTRAPGTLGRGRQQHLHLRGGPAHRLSASDVWLLLYCSLSWSATARNATLISLLYGVPYERWEPRTAAEVCRLLALQVDALRRPSQQRQQRQHPAIAQRPQQHPQGEQRELHAEVQSLVGSAAEAGARSTSVPRPGGTSAADAYSTSGVVSVAQAQEGFGTAPGRGAVDAAAVAAADVAAAPGPDGSGSRQEPVLQRGPGRPAGLGTNSGLPHGSPADSPNPLAPVQPSLPPAPSSRSGLAYSPGLHSPDRAVAPTPQPVSPMMATWPDDSDVEAEAGTSRDDVTDGDASGRIVSNWSGNTQRVLGPLGMEGPTQPQAPKQPPLPDPPCQATIARRFTFEVLGLACSWLARQLEYQQQNYPYQQSGEAAASGYPSAPRTPGRGPLGSPSLLTRSSGSYGSSSLGPASANEPSLPLLRTPSSATGGIPSMQPLEGPWSMRPLVLLLWSAGRLRMPLPVRYRRVLHTTLQGALSTEAPRDLVPLLWSCCRLGVPLGPPGGLQAAMVQRRELSPWALAPWQMFMMLEVLARWRVAPPLAWSQKMARRLVWWPWARPQRLADVMLLLLATRSVLMLRNAARASAAANAALSGGVASHVQHGQRRARRLLRRHKGRQPGAPRLRPSRRASPLDPHIWAQLWPLLQACTVRHVRRLFGIHLSHEKSKARSATRLRMPFSRPPLRPSPPKHRLALLRCVLLLGLARDREWAAWGVPALQRLAHELDPAEYPAWLALVAHLQGYVSRSALEELLLGWCLACASRLQSMSSFRLHNTLLSAARVSAVLQLPLSRCWCSEALTRYSRICGQLRPGQLAAVPAVLLALRRVPPPQWQAAYAAVVRRALPGMGGAAVAAMLRNAAELSPEMGGLLRGVVSEHMAFVKRQQQQAAWQQYQQQQQAEMRREAAAPVTMAAAVRQQVLQQA